LYRIFKERGTTEPLLLYFSSCAHFKPACLFCQDIFKIKKDVRLLKKDSLTNRRRMAILCIIVHKKKDKFMARKDDCPISFRVNRDEHQLITQWAKDDDRSIASFVKLLVLSALKVQVSPLEKEQIRLFAQVIATKITEELDRNQSNGQSSAQ
jgi:uncharacterized protein (DUF1778 family)